MSASFFACFTAGAAFAQQPSPAQVQQRIQADPELAARLRTEIAKGALTPEQVRARLRAAGYPESLLNEYLPDSTGIPGSSDRDSLINAVSTLGLIEPSVAAQLRSPLSLAPPTPRLPNDSPRIDGLPIFGLDIFRGAASRFEPTLTGGVGADYRIGPGDVLAVILTGGVERAYSLDVSREGFVLIPQAGQVYVANLTLSQAQDVLFSRLKQSYSSLSRSPNGATRLYVTVARLHTNQVFVIGEVVAPGSYQISSVGTVLTALYAAGGPNDNGTLRAIEVRRGSQLVGTIDLYDYLVRGDASKDIRLESGDIVFVGVQRGRVSIRGPVVRPAVYEMLPGETLANLIQNAGGFRSEAARNRLQVRRILPPSDREPGGRDRVVLDISPSQFAAGTPSFLLMPGDRVEVFPISSPERNSIVVSGDVWSPGLQGFTPGMTLSQALQKAGGVRPDVYIDQVLISRLEPDQTRRSIHASLRDTTGTVAQDVTLQEDDSVQVFSRTEFATQRYVAIGGAVHDGGRYAYRTGMTLRELLLEAGGPLESADLREAEIARFPSRPTPGVIAQTMRVPLDSSYLFERRPDGTYIGPPGVSLPAVKAPEVALNPYDNVLIFRQPDWQLPATVKIVGEVRYPGSYSLKTRTERLTDLLERAGGLTERADPNALTFFRRADSVGRIGVDLSEVLHDKKSRDNFVLEAGDSILVEAFKPYVRVVGAVNSPTAVAYVRGASLEYYVSAAGGPTQNANYDRRYVRQPNGSVESYRSRFLLPVRNLVPLAGATVVVPASDPAAKSDYSSLVTALTPMIATALTLITILVRR
ncbi:MAG TPA: SLBB domain-containing protein [Gemmatimonadaceae bacterium]|nr:SLBB domain-containing protein [Gemmatimonadaceae bacterium]